MGRDKKQYVKSLRQQAYEKLTSMQAFGESKRQAKKDGTYKEKIFSYSTYDTYWQHIKKYVSWCEKEHPDVTTLKKARKYVPEWLAMRVSGTDGNGKHLSAWTIQTEEASLNKLFHISPDDPEHFKPPVRHRSDIVRSRVEVVRDSTFSVTNNDALIRFAKCTGARRSVMEKLEGRDYFTKEMIREKIASYMAKDKLTDAERKDLKALKEAMEFFPDQSDFVHHRNDKGGRSRYAPIIGPEKDKAMVIERFRETAPNQKVWYYVNSHADIHSYRADYSTRVYKLYARDIKDIPYDRINKGLGYKYQSGVYRCKGDEKGKVLDQAAMVKTTRALGHTRIDVIAGHYLRAL